jgi:hypothetical protein
MLFDYSLLLVLLLVGSNLGSKQRIKFRIKIKKDQKGALMDING